MGITLAAIPPRRASGHTVDLSHNEIRVLRRVLQVKSPPSPSSSRADELSFLKPKVTPPRPPLGVIGRPRLSALADRVEASVLTLVCAPAGYGKTTLALEWADALRKRGSQVAWLSLDPDDDDPLRFMYYVLRALEQAQALQGPGADGDRLGQIGVSTSELLAVALNQTMEHGEEVYLFIDDFHHVASQATQELTMNLLRHAPSNLHLVLLSRVASTLPLSRLQAQGLVLAVDARELRFTAEETGSLLRASALPPTCLSGLQALTEGWAAALKLAVLARQGREGAVASPSLGGMARLAELAGELLTQLPAEEVAFLEQTALAERLCASLCEAMTGIAESQAMLERLERRMLLTRLTEDGTWFSCHQLLREVLMARLAASGRDALAVRHEGASRWYARQANWSEAVRHALLAGAVTQAIQWIEQCAMALVKRGDLLTLLNWEAQLRTALVGCPLLLRLAIAWAHVLGAYQPDNVRLLDAIEEEAHLADPAQAAQIRWECKVARAIHLAQSEQPCAAHELAAQCMQGALNDTWMVNSVYNVQVFCHLKALRWPDFYASPVLPYYESEHESNVFSSIYRFTLRGLGHYLQLDADASKRHFEEALQLGVRYTGEHSLPTALPAVLLARLHYDRLAFDEAAQLLEGRLSIIPASGFDDAIHAAFSIAARLEYRQGNRERANQLLEQACSIAHGLHLVSLEVVMLYEREHLLLRSGRLWEARACLKRIEQLAEQAHPDPDYRVEIAIHAALARCEIDIQEGRIDDASTALRHWYDWAIDRGACHLALRCTAALAVASAQANPDAANEALLRYFELAAPHGIKATLLDAGPDVAALLTAFSTSPAAHTMTSEATALLHALTGSVAQSTDAAALPLNRLLSPREREILGLIASEKSNKEISRILSIAPETVKTHIKHLFAKLEVNRRTHAVKRGISLGLVRRPQPDRAG